MKEIRSNNIINSADEESRKVEGYAVVFDSESVDLGGFTEVISRDAISEETIKNSDILFLLDHDKSRGLLARSKNGSGSLTIEIDNHGVKYSFEAPKTALGDEVLEGLRRGDINKCSFAFTVAADSWTKRNDGSVLRTIEAIEQLFDMSIVYNPAYEETNVVNKRGLEELEDVEEKEAETDEKEAEEEVKTSDAEEVTEKDEDVEETETDKEADTEDKETDDEKSDEDTEDVEDKEDDEDDEKRNVNNDNLYIKTNNTQVINNMKNNKFSLVGAIRNVVNRSNFDEVTNKLIVEGRAAAAQSGIAANGQIVLPIEMRAEGDAAETPAAVTPNGLMATEATMGKEAVPTDLWDIMGALRDKLVLAEAGAQFITASGNIEIPVYDGSSVFWEDEIGEAQDGAGKWSKVALSPKRMTAFVDISKQLINQTNASVENMIREDLVNAIAEKLQKTILGNGAGSANTPKGIFNGVTADTAAFAYDDAVSMEAALEENNVYGDFAVICAPSAKAALRTTPVDKGSGKFVYDNNEVLGIKAYSTNSVVSKGVVLGDWKQLVIANFGALDITIDEVSRAAYGQLRLVVNFYVDYAAKRNNAFVKRILK